jgi:hypothetical protein
LRAMSRRCRASRVAGSSPGTPAPTWYTSETIAWTGLQHAGAARHDRPEQQR